MNNANRKCLGISLTLPHFRYLWKYQVFRYEISKNSHQNSYHYYKYFNSCLIAFKGQKNSRKSHRLKNAQTMPSLKNQSKTTPSFCNRKSPKIPIRIPIIISYLLLSKVKKIIIAAQIERMHKQCIFSSKGMHS